EEQSLGGSLRSAKNYLVALSLLKEKRLAEGAKMSGANVRSAWAVTLWGDPTVKLPAPPRPDGALPAARPSPHGRNLVLAVPEKTYPAVKVDRFQTNMAPNARLAGLLTASEDSEDVKSLVPLLFAEVSLPRAQEGKVPRLSSRLSSKNYVWLWDERR